MKRVILVLCSVALLLSLSGCGILDEIFGMVKEDFGAVKEEDSGLVDNFKNLFRDEEVAMEESGAEDPADIAAGTGTALPEESFVPERVQADPALVEEALYLYSWFIDASLVQVGWDYSLYEMYHCDVTGVTAADLGRWGDPYAISGFYLADLSGDGIPELILKAGEVEQEFFVYTARNGVVDCTGYGYMDNQTGNDMLNLYWNSSTQEYVTVSAGESGSGAGNYGFTCYVGQDLQVYDAPFYTMDEYSDEVGYYTVWYVDGYAVSEEEYIAAKDRFYADLIYVESPGFTSFGESRSQVFTEVSAMWQGY